MTICTARNIRNNIRNAGVVVNGFNKGIIIRCARCGRTFQYRAGLFSPRTTTPRNPDRYRVVYIRCPECGGHALYTNCPICGTGQRLDKDNLVVVERCGERYLAFKCRVCGHQELLERLGDSIALVMTRKDLIGFRSTKALRHLLQRGVVATMRNRDEKPGKLLLVNGKYLALVEEVVDTTPENIEKYWRISGFSSPSEWKAIAMSLHRRKLPPKIIVLRLVR